MRSPSALLSLLLVLLPAQASSCGSPEPRRDAIEGLADIYDAQGRKSIVRIDGPEQQSKGVVLGDGGWVLTAAGPLGDAAAVKVETVDARSDDARVVARDERRGLALLRLGELRLPAVHLALDGVPPVETEVYLFVDDPHLGWATASGRITARRRTDAGELLRLSARAEPREFGGAAFDVKSAVVGIVVPDDLVGRDVRASYVQPVPELLEFLRSAGGPLR